MDGYNRLDLLNGANHALAEAHARVARLASIIESLEDAVISHDLAGNVLIWNQGATALYGYSAEQMTGGNVSRLVAPAQMEEERAIRAQIAAGQRVQQLETVRVRKDGVLIDVSLTISPIIEDGFVTGASQVARDLFDRKRLEAANAQLAAVVESSEDAIISKDLSGNILTWNLAAERLYGYRAADAIGRSIALLLPPGREQEEQEILRNIQHGERVDHFETVRLKSDGSEVHVSLAISPIRDRSGRVTGASHIARDITGARQMEIEMRQTQRLESVGVLAGGIAHDFNNLLTGILGNATLAAELLPEKHAAQNHLRDLTQAAQRAADLTMQLLAYSGKGQFVIAPLDVSDLVPEITPLIKASIPKWVTVQLELSVETPLVNADRSQLHQLVMNMIINGAEAIPAGEPGSVLVRTGVQPVDEDYLRATLPGWDIAPGDYVFIEVRDNGCGMDKETLSRIFDPFFSTKFTGRGLGLAAALGIVKGHKGAIKVISRPGAGTTFKVLLPVFNKGAPRGSETPKKPKGTILVVDDEEVVRKVAKSALESRGYSVITAGNGREAVERFAEMPNSISLVLLDLTMPVLDGELALEKLRAIRGDIPVLLSSGYAEAEVMRRFGQASPAGFIQKPYKSTQLRDKIDLLLGEQRPCEPSEGRHAEDNTDSRG